MHLKRTIISYIKVLFYKQTELSPQDDFENSLYTNPCSTLNYYKNTFRITEFALFGLKAAPILLFILE